VINHNECRVSSALAGEPRLDDDGLWRKVNRGLMKPWSVPSFPLVPGFPLAQATRLSRTLLLLSAVCRYN
ncbi:MAG: hypothetical protein QMC41_02860, partial [Halioglobus sp.]